MKNQIIFFKLFFISHGNMITQKIKTFYLLVIQTLINSDLGSFLSNNFVSY